MPRLMLMPHPVLQIEPQRACARLVPTLLLLCQAKHERRLLLPLLASCQQWMLRLRWACASAQCLARQSQA